MVRGTTGVPTCTRRRITPLRFSSPYASRCSSLTPNSQLKGMHGFLVSFASALLHRNMVGTTTLPVAMSEQGY